MTDHSYAALYDAAGPRSRQASHFDLSHAELIRVTKMVCCGLAGIEPEPENRAGLDVGDVLIGSIVYTGEWRGILSVQYGMFEAIALAHRLLGPSPDITSYAIDLIGELANMVAGNLKPALPRGADTGIPSVIVVSPSAPRMDDRVLIQQAFAFEGGRLVVSFRG